MPLRRLNRFTILFLVLINGTLACDVGRATALLGGGGKPTVAIISPPSASQFQEGQAVAVQSSSTDGQGIAKVELVVDGVLVHTDLPPQPQPQFTLVQTWTATSGTHTILVRATNTANVTSDPVSISVSVGASVALTGTPSPTGTLQAGPGTFTPTATVTNTPNAPAPPLPPPAPNNPPPAPNNPPPAPNNPPPAPNTPQPRVGSSGWTQLEPLKTGKITGVLLAGNFRTQPQLNGMSPDDQRNTLITELGGRTAEPGLQGLDDKTLAADGAVLVFIRAAKIRNDQDIKALRIDDLRNILIVEIRGATGTETRILQSQNNLNLVRIALGAPPRWFELAPLNDGSIYSVLLVGKFRTQAQLDGMSANDQRNTLITELGGRTSDSGPFLQGLDDKTLAGDGALLVFIRAAKIRTDQEIKTVHIDDLRNILIVVLGSVTGQSGSFLQGQSNLALVQLARDNL